MKKNAVKRKIKNVKNDKSTDSGKMIAELHERFCGSNF